MEVKLKYLNETARREHLTTIYEHQPPPTGAKAKAEFEAALMEENVYEHVPVVIAIISPVRLPEKVTFITFDWRICYFNVVDSCRLHLRQCRSQTVRKSLI